MCVLLSRDVHSQPLGDTEIEVPQGNHSLELFCPKQTKKAGHRNLIGKPFFMLIVLNNLNITATTVTVTATVYMMTCVS